jgi:hypothetical protein
MARPTGSSAPSDARLERQDQLSTDCNRHVQRREPEPCVQASPTSDSAIVRKLGRRLRRQLSRVESTCRTPQVDVGAIRSHRSRVRNSAGTAACVRRAQHLGHDLERPGLRARYERGRPGRRFAPGVIVIRSCSHCSLVTPVGRPPRRSPRRLRVALTTLQAASINANSGGKQQ